MTKGDLKSSSWLEDWAALESAQKWVKEVGQPVLPMQGHHPITLRSWNNSQPFPREVVSEMDSLQLLGFSLMHFYRCAASMNRVFTFFNQSRQVESNWGFIIGLFGFFCPVEFPTACLHPSKQHDLYGDEESSTGSPKPKKKALACSVCLGFFSPLKLLFICSWKVLKKIKSQSKIPLETTCPFLIAQACFTGGQ